MKATLPSPIREKSTKGLEIINGEAFFDGVPIPLGKQSGQPVIVTEYNSFLTMLKKILQLPYHTEGFYQGINEPTENAKSPETGKHPFTCGEANWINIKVGHRRGDTDINIHKHNPRLKADEVKFAIEEIRKEIAPIAQPLTMLSNTRSEIIFGDKNNPDAQIKYTLRNDGKYLVTAGKAVNAVIIDPAGKMIEINNGHIHEYGKGGNLITEGCKGHHHHNEKPATHIHDSACEAGCSHDHHKARG